MNKPKVLVVDDEIDVCTCIQKYFGKRGFSVSTTGSGVDAVSMIQASKYDVVLLDLALPDLNGKEVLECVRKNDKETKVIIISGQLNAKVIDELYNLGIEGYYTKPIILNDTFLVVCKALGLPPPADFDLTSQQAVSRPKVERGGIAHQLSNKINIISTECEGFLDDLEEGLLKHKSHEELFKMTVEILKDIKSTAISTIDILNQMEEK